MIDKKKIETELLALYKPHGPERVGFVLDNSIVEVINIADNTEEGFLVDPSDVIHYTEELSALATWHTHPNEKANLSGDDYATFRAYPLMLHYIIGSDGVRCFKYDQQIRSVVEVV